MKKQKETTEKSSRQVVSGASAIQSLVAKPLTIKFSFGEQDCELTGRFLLPFEVEILRLLLDEVGAPPLLKTGSTPNPALAGTPAEIYDWADGEYQKKKTKKERFVRALSIFYAIEDIQQLMLGEAEKESAEALGKAKALVVNRYTPTSHQVIVDWMHRKFVDEILEAIYVQIRQAPISVPKQVNLS